MNLLILFQVVFGGASRYSGDDLNKFMWMIRIGSGVFPFMPHEQDFISSVGVRIKTAVRLTIFERISV